MDDCTKCPDLLEMQHHIKTHEDRINKLEANDGSINKLLTDLEVLIERVSNMQSNINGITNTVDKLSTDVGGVKTDVTIIKNVSKEVESLRTDVNNIKQEPAEEYKFYKRSIINKILIAIVSLAIGIMLNIKI